MLRACNALCARISAAVTSQGFTAVTFSAVPAVEVRNAVLAGLTRELAGQALNAIFIAFIIDVDSVRNASTTRVVCALSAVVPLTQENGNRIGSYARLYDLISM